MRIGILTGNDKLEYSSIDHFIEKIEESFQRLGCEIKRYGIVEDNN
ncbi:hypothetical protein [Aneurinibacillus sp. UBA3580]|jgi:hypothetical protein|nr:hypothetical protein [Aneurinibacillus sp. UBA3580]